LNGNKILPFKDTGGEFLIILEA